MTTPKPSQVEQPPDLTSEDDAILDHVWDTITDADIEASIKWLDEIEAEERDDAEK